MGYEESKSTKVGRRACGVLVEGKRAQAKELAELVWGMLRDVLEQYHVKMLASYARQHYARVIR